MTTVCDTCNQPKTNVVMRENGNAECMACWAASLAHGHRHGMHVDEHGEPSPVADCPLCLEER